MKISGILRHTTSLLLIICLFAPIVALAGGEGKKRFKNGIKFEDTEQWDKAAEEFALAIVDSPKNAEYRLHYRRALFNASQMFMKTGNTLAEEKDYAGAYMAFRKAYGYDPTNQLAKAEMDRMIRLKESVDNPQKKDDGSDATRTPDMKIVKTSYSNQPPDDVIPQKLEKLRDIPFPTGVDLQWLIRELAKDLDLNVLFDEETFRTERKVKIELKNVTAAKALDYLFMQTSLFFQKVGPRTIVVANQNRRQNFQQLILRTFYLGNADPTEVAKTIISAIPPQPGRTPTGVLTDKATNSITVRDTEENVKLIGKLIKSLDKDRSEVVMDVNIFEVSKNDLLQIGNQIGSDASLTNLGGVGQTTRVSDPFTIGNLAGALANGLRLPVGNFKALQGKSDTKLLASTQVHAFNNEESTARIGQRVPVQTASVIPFNNSGSQQGSGIGGGYPVINYEQVGLTLKFTPIVFPNQDVQVKMEIESKDVAGASSLTPIFTERSIKGTARIRNNQTLLLASVAQGTESDSRRGLPLISFLPVIGRLFSAPQKENRQVDIVIAVTPRVLRAPIILDEDLVERPTGSLATPTSGSLEAMIVQEEREEQLAAARRISNTAKLQLPDQPLDAPTYVKSKTSEEIVGNTKPTARPTLNTVSLPSNDVSAPKIGDTQLKPIDSSPRTLPLVQTSEPLEDKQPIGPAVKIEEKALTIPKAKLNVIMPYVNEMKVGEKARILVSIESESAFRSAIVAVGFDPKKVAIRRVSYGDVFGNTYADKQATPYFNSNGKMYITLSADELTSVDGTNVLAYLEIEALAAGKPEISLVQNMFGIINENGQSFVLAFGR